MTSISRVICLTRCKHTKKKKYSLIPLISGREVSMGRGVDVSVQLLSRNRDSMILLSRKHAIFKENEDGKWTITDNKSLNGVYLNNVKLKAGSPFPIEKEDMIQIGALQEGETEAEFIFQVKEEQLSAEVANQILDRLNPANMGKRRNSQEAMPVKQINTSKVVQENVTKRKRCDNLRTNKVMKCSESKLRTDEPSSSNHLCERTGESERTKLSLCKKRANLGEEEGEILNAILSRRGKHSIQDLLQLIQSKSLSPSKKKEDNDLRLKLEEKEKLLKTKEEEMRLMTENLKARALEKENCLMEQLEKQREQLVQDKLNMEIEMKELANNLEAKAHKKEMTLMEQLTQQRGERKDKEKTLQENLAKLLAEKDENFNKEQERLRKELEDRIKQKEEEMLAEIEAQKKVLQVEKQTVEESLQSEVAKNLEQREKLKQERKRLEEVIANKDKDYKSMQTKLEEGQKAREVEEVLKIAKAKQEAFDNITDVLESELQCSICAELFIQATTLNCSHSFCKYCILLWMKRKKECPVCRASIKSHNPSIVLDNYIDKMVESLGEDVKARRKEMLVDRKKTEGSNVRSAVVALHIISDGDDDDDDEDDDGDESVEFIDSHGMDSDDSDNFDDGLPGAYYGGYGSCYICGMRGHWSNGCPNA